MSLPLVPKLGFRAGVFWEVLQLWVSRRLHIVSSLILPHTLILLYTSSESLKSASSPASAGKETVLPTCMDDRPTRKHCTLYKFLLSLPSTPTCDPLLLGKQALKETDRHAASTPPGRVGALEVVGLGTTAFGTTFGTTAFVPSGRRSCHPRARRNRPVGHHCRMGQMGRSRHHM